MDNAQAHSAEKNQPERWSVSICVVCHFRPEFMNLFQLHKLKLWQMCEGLSNILGNKFGRGTRLYADISGQNSSTHSAPPSIMITHICVGIVTHVLQQIKFKFNLISAPTPSSSGPITSDCFWNWDCIAWSPIVRPDVDGLSFNELPVQEEHQHNTTIVLMAITSHSPIVPSSFSPFPHLFSQALDFI